MPVQADHTESLKATMQESIKNIDQPQSIQDEKITALMHKTADNQNEAAADSSSRLEKLEYRMLGVEDGVVEVKRQVTEVKASVSELQQSVTNVHESVAENTTATKTTLEGVGEILGLFATLKNGIKVLGWIGSGMKWLTAIAAGFATVYGAIYAIVQNIKAGH